ncbi:mercuric transporter MerT family protein [Hahella ganghwensis]|uniref:mercuric transporter MerT family protein n=1 Tax=Hahella ganghwensis TaxID=286420 RepID=UPI0003802B2B|nr:mercuric transporter MerT family protein [Hahella ganghwensis]
MKKGSPVWLLSGGLVAAFGASLCCTGPFIILLLGVSGSWISTLAAFEPYRAYLIATVIVLYLFAGWLVHRPIERCSEGSVCSIPESRQRYQILFWIFTVVALLLVLSPYWLAWLA